MSEVVRLYRYKALLGGRRALPADELMAQLEISRATLKRDLAKLRDQLNVPIRFDRERGGYVLDPQHNRTELPGLWFSPEEITALVTTQQLLAELAPGVLGPRLRPLRARLNDLMGKAGLDAGEVARRIRIVHAGRRQLKAQHFEAVAAATLGRRRLHVTHFSRQDGTSTQRVISPQRLVHYRDNWYVDAWCHLREDLRSFSVDALSDVAILDEASREIADARIDEMVASGYGIFSGIATAQAVLKFSPARARWVRREIWHPAQETREEPDGSFVIAFPYADERELVGDILRYGAQVQVLAPEGLRKKVQRALLEAAARYV